MAKRYKTTTDDKLDQLIRYLVMDFIVKKRISNNGVPHIVGTLADGSQFSICWFWKYRNYRIFHPYPSNEQTRTNCKTPYEVAEALRELQPEVNVFYHNMKMQAWRLKNGLV